MRLPIKALKELAKKYGYSHVVVYAYDTKNNMQHIATYGRTIYEADQAAQFGDFMKDALHWPESLHAMPNRVKKLQAAITGFEKALEEVLEAYPMDVFPDTTQAERDQIDSGFISRTSAMMGRHIAKVIRERSKYFSKEKLEEG